MSDNCALKPAHARPPQPNYTQPACAVPTGDHPSHHCQLVLRLLILLHSAHSLLAPLSSVPTRPSISDSMCQCWPSWRTSPWTPALQMCNASACPSPPSPLPLPPLPSSLTPTASLSELSFLLTQQKQSLCQSSTIRPSRYLIVTSSNRQLQLGLVGTGDLV